MNIDIKTWMCSACGYMMDKASPIHKGEKAVVVKDGDMSICINCGCVYAMKKGDWSPAVREDLVDLPKSIITELAMLKVACEIRRAVMGDLTTKEGGNT